MPDKKERSHLIYKGLDYSMQLGVLICFGLLTFFGMAECKSQDLPDRNWHLRIPFDGRIGVNYMEFGERTGDRVRQNLGSFISVNTGVSITRKELWGVAFTAGGNLDNYGFGLGGDSYSLTVAMFRAQSKLFLLLPFQYQDDTNLEIGLVGGYTFYDGADLKSNLNGWSILAQAERRNAAYIAPEIGLSQRLNRHRLNLSISYQYHFDRSSPNFSVELENGDSKTISTGHGDNLSLNIGFQMGFKKHELPKFDLPEINYRDRENDQLEAIRSNRGYVKMVLWDNADVDGDTISVIVNGECVLSEYQLTKEKLKLRINLKPDENIILVVAHNEGRVSPNTASCEIRTGLRREKIKFRTSLKENDEIRVYRD